MHQLVIFEGVGKGESFVEIDSSTDASEGDRPDAITSGLWPLLSCRQPSLERFVDDDLERLPGAVSDQFQITGDAIFDGQGCSHDDIITSLVAHQGITHRSETGLRAARTNCF